jgi:hypothetical protein
MDKKLIKFFKKDEYLRNAIASGKDVYSAFAAKLFNCDYLDCLEFNPDTNEPNPLGLCRRKIAKAILCSMYFSTKKKYHKAAFKMFDEIPAIITKYNPRGESYDD